MTDMFPEQPILIVDDEKPILNSFKRVLYSYGIDNILLCEDSREVIPILNEKEIEVLLLDLAMPHITGEELLRSITSSFPEIPVIIVTGFNEVERAVECMRNGAFDYMVKPVEGSRLSSGVKHALEVRELQRENTSLKDHILSDQLTDTEAFKDIVTNNRAMFSIFRYMEAISRTSQCVLVTGETGAGKELVVRTIHRLSKRTGNFVAVNVAGLDDHMFSDTLFGHKKGAFTGAGEVRKGLIEKAAGGTLFLDEIGDLSKASQVKLLRLLQEQEYFPLGSDEIYQSTARIIVTTCRNLAKYQKEDKFRKDLFYRLQVHHIHVPSLRERLSDDLALLIDHFLTKSAQELGKKEHTPPPELLQLLGMYDFHGNVRELESLIFDAVSH